MRNKKTPTPKKERKVTDGPIKNKARTKQRMLDSVGKVLMKDGYTGLTIAKVAAMAKVDRKLIYLYFNSLQKLIQTYINSKEYWNVPGNENITQFLDKGATFDQDDIYSILQNQFSSLFTAIELQKIMLWEISEKNKLMRKIADGREEIGENLLRVTDAHFKNSDVDFRSILALLVGGIYYLNLHAKSNGSTFCGIDINKPDGRKRVLGGLKATIDLAYSTLKSKK